MDDDTAAQDPMSWEEAEMDKLEAWATRMNVKETSAAYRERAKYIKLKATALMKAWVGDAGEKVKPGVGFDPITKWLQVKSGPAKDKESAKPLLSNVKGEGHWKQDVRCPRSAAKGGLAAYRFVNVEAVGGPYLARLVDIGGGRWRVETPVFKQEDDSEEGEEEEDGDTPADQGAAAEKKDAKKKKVPAPPPAAESAKRPRRAPVRS